MNVKPESMQHALEEYEVYISTQSALEKNEHILEKIKSEIQDAFNSAAEKAKRTRISA